jgi:hypothetical protein
MIAQHRPAAGALKSLAAPLAVSAALVAPFIVLEWANRRTAAEAFPVGLFLLMSLHALVIVLSVTPALRRFHAEKSLNTLTAGHWAGLLLGVLLGLVYALMVLDQLPCFLGVPNCD